MTGPRSVWRSTGRNLLRIVPVLIVLALWQLASATGVLPKSLMPSLREVGAALVGLIASGEIVPHTIASLGRAGGGFFIAVVFGVAIGVLMARVHSVQLALDRLYVAGLRKAMAWHAFAH
jgi:ABC-type nitrate/sulfonate/bicarbonate transport system permease component